MSVWGECVMLFVSCGVVCDVCLRVGSLCVWGEFLEVSCGGGTRMKGGDE